jgi:Alpha/beta hydrolase family
MTWSKRKIFRIVWFGAAFIFVAWNAYTLQSRGLPSDTFLSDDRVEVLQTDNEFLFRSKTPKSSLEIIFFQGGLADPKAYAPLCRRLAQGGYTCHLIRMDYRLPVKNYHKISALFDLKSGQYVIGGHSQGAKMAAQFVYENPGLMKGLFLMGTSHPRDMDLSSQSIPTIKFYAENDGLASADEVMQNKGKLPQGTELIFIRGGNHSQFGYLGGLLTDGAATISLTEQQDLVFNDLLRFLKER